MIQRYLIRQSRAIFPRLHPSSRLSLSSSNPFSSPRTAVTSSFLHPTAPRCYTTSAEAEVPPNVESQASEKNQLDTKEAQEEDPSKKELEAKTKEIIDLKDKYLRSVAEFRNLQERTKRDIQAARDFAISRFAVDLMESVDNLDRALSTVPAEQLSPGSEAQSSDESSSIDENKALVDLYQGLKMTETILMQTLKKHGLERFDPSEDGTRFDPRLHEATFQTKVEGKEDGEVVMVQSKGFTLNGRVLRVRSFLHILIHDYAKIRQSKEHVLPDALSFFSLVQN
ncbi:Mitochondrial matrix cochaperone [Pseudocyphellaria aurata]|nr:Mitochondrial matrix cochaperone [Pseudocyphellaria aurata]